MISMQQTVSASKTNAAVLLATKSHPVGHIVKHVAQFSVTIPLRVAGQLAEQTLEKMFSACGIMNAGVTLILIMTAKLEFASPK